MKLELKLSDKTFWVEFKDTFTRKEMKQWWDAQEMRYPKREKDEDGNLKPLPEGARDAAFQETEQRMLNLLCQWCPTCFFEDVDGNIYNAISELSSEVLDNFDWALVDFLFNVPLYARAKRSRLGEVVGLPRLRTMR